MKMRELNVRTSLLALTILATGFTALSPRPAVAQDTQEEERTREEGEEKAYQFKFKMDDHPMHLRDFAMHIDPPDLSGLEDLHVKLREPFRLWSWSEPGRFAEQQREIAELERESRDLAQRAREVEGSEGQQLESELRDMLEEIFDKKMELRRERADVLEQRLREEREKLRERSEARENMIDRRLHRLMGEDDVLEW